MRTALERGASRRNTAVLLKAGADDPRELATLMETWIADPADVQCPFLSIAGGAEPAVMTRQALE